MPDPVPPLPPAAAPASDPDPAVDGSVWRVVGTPLVAPAGSGALDGVRVAVKDLVAVAGHPVGAGVPAWLDAAAPEPAHAPALLALLAAGASVRGIARTDELAYSIAGRNPHYGTPPNVAVPGGLPGGSSSGPAAAVALGEADLGLATDTAGSIRVPASYQGLWGLRTTHGSVRADGVLPLAPSFDTVGWLARDAGTLRAAAAATFASPAAGHADAGPAGWASGQPRTLGGAVVDRAVLASLDPAVAAALASAAEALDPTPVDLTDAVGPLADLAAAFRAVQGAEAWRAHGAWLTAHPGALGPEIAARFRWASGVTPEREAEGRVALTVARARLEELLDDRLLVLPSAASPAPDASSNSPDTERIRTATLRLTCLAGVLGAPALSVPAGDVDGAPVGLGLVGPRGSDLDLLDVAVALYGDTSDAP